MTDTEKTQITKLLEEIARVNRFPNIVARGLVTGLFTAIGATIAFTMVLFLFTQLYSGIRGIPIIKDIMQSTGLSAVVDYALEQVNKPQDTKTITVKKDEEVEEPINMSGEAEFNEVNDEEKGVEELKYSD